MPEIGAAIAAISTAVASGVAAVSAVTGLSTAVVSNVALALASTALNAALSGGGGTPSVNLSQKLQSQISQGQPQFVVVGQTALAGHRAFDGTHGGDNDTEYLTHVVILSYKPIHSLIGIRVNGEVATFVGDVTSSEQNATNTPFQGAPATGGIPSPRFRARVFKGHNNAGEGLGQYLASMFPNEFNITTNFGDYAVAVLQFQKTDDDLVEENDAFVNKSPFQSPPSYRFEVEGATVFDPRDVSQSYDDPSSWVYNNNSALVEHTHDIGWFSGTRVERLLAGSGYPFALLDVEQAKENADYCDSKGFTCNGILVSNGRDDGAHIRATYGGVRYEDPGLIYSVPRANRAYAGSVDLTNARLEHIEEFDAWGRSSQTPNAVVTRYSNPDVLYEEDVLEYYAEQTQIDADGGITNTFTQDIRMVTNSLRATDLRTMELAFQRRAKTLKLKDLPPYHSGLKGGSRIDVLGTGNPLIDDVQWAVAGVGQDESLATELVLTEQPLDAELVTDAGDYPTITSSVTIIPDVNSFTVFTGAGQSTILGVSLSFAEHTESGVEGAAFTISGPTVTVTGAVSLLSYVWAQISGPTITFSPNNEAQSPSFTGTIPASSGTALLSLTVSDGYGFGTAYLTINLDVT